MKSKSRILYAGLVLAVLALAAAVRLVDPAPIERLRLMVFDSYQALWPRIYDPDVPVRVVDIDDVSLKKHGQWPWSRRLLAALAKQLVENGAAAIGFNFVMGEPDRDIVGEIAKWLPDDPAASGVGQALAKLPAGDAVFAEQIAAAPVVVSFVANNDDDTLPALRAGFAFVGDDPRLFVPLYRGAAVTLPLLQDASKGSGALNWIPRHDQVIRNAPLLVRLGDRLYPSFAAELVRVAEGANNYVIKSSGSSSEESFGRATGIAAVRIGRFEVPTDANGEMWLRFTRSDPRRTIPASRVLDGTVERGAIEGRIVLVGIGAASLFEGRTTPLEASTTSTDVQAQVVEQILLGDHLLRPDFATGAELVLLVVAGIALAFVVHFVGALWSALFGFIMLAGAIVGSAAAYQNFGFLFDPVYPAIALIVLYIVTTVFRYWQTEAERRYVRDAFGRYMSPALVDELAANPERLRLGGEMRTVTLMFSDLRGFTSMSERLTPEQLVGLLNHYLEGMVGVIDRHGGTIDEFIGDAIFVLFGAPFSKEDDAQRAVACAVAMQLAMPSINEENGRQGLPELEMGIGIHTGQVVVGNIGSTERMKYGVVGSHVNLASRIQSYTTGGQILISEATARAAGPGLKLGRRLEVKAKGVKQPVAVSEVLGIETQSLYLPDAAGGTAALAEPIRFGFSIVEGAHLAKEMSGGSLVRLGAKEAEAQLETAVPNWTNLELHLTGHNGAAVPGVLYAKVVAVNGAAYSLKFTSVPPELRAFLNSRTRAGPAG